MSVPVEGESPSRDKPQDEEGDRDTSVDSVEARAEEEEMSDLDFIKAHRLKDS